MIQIMVGRGVVIDNIKPLHSVSHLIKNQLTVEFELVRHDGMMRLLL